MTHNPLSLWSWKIGRLAWFPRGTPAAVGWRKLWGRLRWRTESPVARELRRVLNKPPVHWHPQGHEYATHFCGANMRELWALSLKDVTCPICLERGEPVLLRYLTTVR